MHTKERINHYVTQMPPSLPPSPSLAPSPLLRRPPHRQQKIPTNFHKNYVFALSRMFSRVLACRTARLTLSNDRSFRSVWA